MEKLTDKLNIFDIFTMLIPGIFSFGIISLSLAGDYYSIWEKTGNEKYVLFCIVSYVYGIFLQEFGAFCDQKFVYENLYGGRPRELFLQKKWYEEIWNNEVAYEDALKIKEHFEIDFDKKNENESNALMFAYCVNFCELNGMSGKIDRMLAISEMARSLYWGCVLAIAVNVILLIQGATMYKFLVLEIIILSLLAPIFMHRKKRFEQYYIRMLVRTFLICSEKKFWLLLNEDVDK